MMPDSMSCLISVFLTWLLVLLVSDQQLLREHGSFWDRTNAASTAASSGHDYSSYSQPPEEAPQVDPETSGSLICCELQLASLLFFWVGWWEIDYI